MAWYAAHVVMVIKFKNCIQDKYPLWENIILIQAEDDDTAFQKAETRARQDEGDSQGTFTHEGRPARWVFAGIRRLVDCTDPSERPTDGTEITYLEIELPDHHDFQHYLDGKPVKLLYE